MMVGSSPLPHSLLSSFLALAGDLILGQHANVGTDPEGLSRGLGVAVKQTGVKEDEVSSLGVHFNILVDWLLNLLLLREEIPVIFIIAHSLPHKVFMMQSVSSRHTYKPSSISISVGQSHDPLVTPQIIFGWRLIGVKERVIIHLLVVSSPIHEAEPIERCFHRLSIPKFLKQRLTQFPQFPLRLGVANVLDHASMQDGRVVLTEDLG